MLRWRLLLGVVLIAALVGLCWLEWHLRWPGIALLPLALVAGRLAAAELIAMFRLRGHQPLAGMVYFGTLMTIVVASAPALTPGAAAVASVGALGVFAMVLAVSLLLALIGEMWRFDGLGRATTNLALTMLAVLYVGGLISFMVQLRLVGGGDGHLGMLALVSLIAVVKMSDVGQYTVGRLFGRHKLAPRISPGKTWEGVLGGFVFACVAAWLVLHCAAPSMIDSGGTAALAAPAGGSLASTMIYAAALTAAGIVGDLGASVFKRDAGVKDSSAWLPGFGGVLDLLDSLLGAAPVAFLFWALAWVGP